MNWQQKIMHLIGQPIGISFMNGQGTSGVLCDAYDGELYVMEYLYQSQFALKHYEYQTIRDINPISSLSTTTILIREKPSFESLFTAKGK